MNGLRSAWIGRVFMNPPYGREIGCWVAKAVNAVESGSAERVVALLPARTDTRWWQSYVMTSLDGVHPRARLVRFLPGRLRFGRQSCQLGAINSAPFPSVVVVWE